MAHKQILAETHTRSLDEGARDAHQCDGGKQREDRPTRHDGRYMKADDTTACAGAPTWRCRGRTLCIMKIRRKQFPVDREVVWVETSDGICEQAIFSASAMEFERGARAPIPAEVTMAWERHNPRAQGAGK